MHTSIIKLAGNPMCVADYLFTGLSFYCFCWGPGYTALHRAASWGHVSCLRVLVTNGADLQLRNTHGERAREAADRYNKADCVEYLDQAGGSV